jgi:hypothetical protein
MAQRLNLHSLQFKTGYARNATQCSPRPQRLRADLPEARRASRPRRCPDPRQANPGGWITTDEWIRGRRACGPTSTSSTSSTGPARAGRATRRSTSARCSSRSSAAACCSTPTRDRSAGRDGARSVHGHRRCSIQRGALSSSPMPTSAFGVGSVSSASGTAASSTSRPTGRPATARRLSSPRIS